MKFKQFIKKLDIKRGLLFFALIQIQVLVTVLFLSFLAVPINFIFEEGALRDVASTILFLLVELVFRFFIFFVFFKNNKNLEFSKFCLSYIIVFILRFIFSLATHFAHFSAGSGTSLLGTTLCKIFINPETKTMQDVPILFYIFLFILCEGLTIFDAYLAIRLCEAQREKAHKELHLD